MSQDDAAARLRSEHGVSADAAEASAAQAVARAASASVAAAADRLLTLDETPWSFDTLRALSAAARPETGR
ncbi:MAG: hypothetical protein AB1592_14920 [Pseudomonadota bacterium]